MAISETIYYHIGDKVFKVISDLPYQIPDVGTADFRIDEAPADYTFRFEKVNGIPERTGRVRIMEEFTFGYEMLNERGEHLRGFHWKERFYDAVLQMGKDEGVVSYVSHTIMAERCQSGFDFINYLALEQMFLRFGGLFLHSSHVRVGDKALLFSAPSGTGKSTQADLWEKHAGAEVMNGDRTLLRKKDGVWHAYGCPMCGTSGIHKQGNEPIHAIVMLSQGTDNTVRRLTPGEAFQRMYPEITVPKWNRELVLRAMELLDDVMANVPIYAFSCTKDESAVTALREAIGL
ncbi:MAG: hypothetical protein IJ418_19475 [Clostridia bacterium]|nr:hypothetical protein [Clostridia bacterium]